MLEVVGSKILLAETNTQGPRRNCCLRNVSYSFKASWISTINRRPRLTSQQRVIVVVISSLSVTNRGHIDTSCITEMLPCVKKATILHWVYYNSVILLFCWACTPFNNRKVKAKPREYDRCPRANAGIVGVAILFWWQLCLSQVFIVHFITDSAPEFVQEIRLTQ